MRPRVARRHAWGTTTITWSTITDASFVEVQATGARLSEESRSAQEMIARFTQGQARKPQSIAADASYGNGEFLQWLMDRDITPYMPTRDAVGRTRSPLYGPERFTYLPESNSYICPAGQQLNYGRSQRKEPHVRLYRNAQEVWPVPTKIPVHNRTTSVPCHPYERSGSATSARSLDDTGVRTRTATAEES
jgi:hypothetical protein